MHPIQTDNKDVMVSFYDATNGQRWRRSTNWLSRAPLGSWFGVTIDAEGMVVELSLPRNDLDGRLPHELGKLSRLRMLNLSGNSLGQPISTAQRPMACHIAVFWLTKPVVRWEGIPSELGNLANLEILDVSHN